MNQQPHPTYGAIKIEYASLSEWACVLGWSCRIGFGELAIRQNFTRSTNPELPAGHANYWVFTPAPGVYLDTEAMGAEFAGEVMKAFYRAQENGEHIPESITQNH